MNAKQALAILAIPGDFGNFAIPHTPQKKDLDDLPSRP
jgi:hypothetical protein